MGLPAYSKLPEERRAPRMDLVALEPHGRGWRVVLWEAKLVGDARARCRGGDLPKVTKQLEAYERWLSDPGRENRVVDANRCNCRLLVGLHRIAKCLRTNMEHLGEGIQKIAESDAVPLSVDVKPRLLIIYDRKDGAFRENGHFEKLQRAGWQVKSVEKMSDLCLCEQA